MFFFKIILNLANLLKYISNVELLVSMSLQITVTLYSLIFTFPIYK